MKKSEQRSSHAVMCLWWLIYSSFCHNVIFWKPAELWLPKSSVMKYPKVIPLLCREASEQSLSPCRGVSLANPSSAICPQKCLCHLDTEPCMTGTRVFLSCETSKSKPKSVSAVPGPSSIPSVACSGMCLWRTPWQSVLNMLLFISQTAQLSEFN